MKRLILFFLFGLSGCSWLIDKPEVNVTGITVSGLDNKGMGIDLLMSVKNPNSFKLDLTGYSYELLVSDINAAKGESHDKVELPGKSVTDVTIPIRLEFSDLKNVLKSSADPEKLPYKFHAALDMSTPLGSYNIPIKSHGNFSLPHNFLLDRILKKMR
jgi:LEA14-like dessication related protein